MDETTTTKIAVAVFAGIAALAPLGLLVAAFFAWKGVGRQIQQASDQHGNSWSR